MRDCGDMVDREWIRVGELDHVRRRAIWVRWTPEAMELCGGREGDDWKAIINRSDPLFPALDAIFDAAVWALDVSDYESARARDNAVRKFLGVTP